MNMRDIGFPVPDKECERRRAIVPTDLYGLKYPEHVFVEQGYGIVLGFSDKEYLRAGANVCSKDHVLCRDVIIDPKVGDASYLHNLSNQTIFGWIHAVQNRDIVDRILNGNLSAYAWEDMFEDGVHCFYRNNEIAGEAAVNHAMLYHGTMLFGKKIAVIGNGNVARGALKVLCSSNADVSVFGRDDYDRFREELNTFDVVVNAVLWDPFKKDHLIYREDLKQMKKDSLIIDISCDRHGGIETSEPTTLLDPIYEIDGVSHYVVDNTPALYWKSASLHISSIVSRFLDIFIDNKETSNSCLCRAHIIHDGVIFNQRIIDFQNR